MRDIACAGYVAGGNATFFTKGADGYTARAGLENIQSRLSFADDVGAKYGSMLAFPCSEQQFSANQGLDTVMSVTSRLLPWEVTGVNARNHSSFPGGEKVYQAYNAALGLDSVHYGEDMKAAGLRRRLKPRLKPYPLATAADRPPACVPLQRTRISFPKDPQTTPRASSVRTAPSKPPSMHLCSPTRCALCRPPPQVRPVHVQLYVARPGPGPVRCRTQTQRRPLLAPALTHRALPARSRSFGPDAIPGDARWRRGESVSLKAARDSMVSLEYAAPPLKHAPCVATRPSANPPPLACAGSRSTRRWSTPSALRASTTAAASRLLTADSAFPLSPGFFAFALLLARLGRTRRGSAARRLQSQLCWCVCACWVWALAHSVGVVG